MSKKKNRALAADTARPLLSVSMIVRNEEKYLRGCLESLRGLADEIVVVDTGSTDSTVAIAREHGAHIHTFEWISDFSAARNESLRHCTGEWVLYIDADERIAQQSRDELLRIVKNSEAFAYDCLLRGEEWLPKGLVHNITPYPRLFRRLPFFRFEGKVHEQIVYSIQRNGYKVLASNVIIDHLGYAQPRDIVVGKCERNVDLLRKQLLEHPDDPYARFELGNTLGMLSRHEEALAELQIALSSPGLPPRIRASILDSLSTISVDEKRLDEGMEYAIASLRDAPRQVTARWIIITLKMGNDDFAGALPFLRQIVEIQTDPKRAEKVELGFDATIPMQEVFFRLGLCCERTGAFADAADAYFEGLRQKVDYRNMPERNINCVDQHTDAAGAVRQLQTLCVTAGETGPVLNCMARCHLKLHDVVAAQQLLDRCRELNVEDDDTAGHLIECSLLEGNEVRAADLYERAVGKGADSHAFHKAALQFVLQRNDLIKAMTHLEGMARDVRHKAARCAAFTPTIFSSPV